ncbi:MAG: hypothetical protein QM755_04455 [Luteolibacter sp.]
MVREDHVFLAAEAAEEGAAAHPDRVGEFARGDRLEAVLGEKRTAVDSAGATTRSGVMCVPYRGTSIL